MAGALWPPVAGNAGPLSLRDIDHSAVHDQFNVLSGRLFCTDAADILVEAATLLAQGNVEKADLESDKALEAYLEAIGQQREDETEDVNNGGAASESGRSQFFFLNPLYGWSSLPVTENGMGRLLDHLGVFAKFFKYLSAFGVKKFAEDEGFGGFDSNVSVNEHGEMTCLELCFLLKYVDRKDDAVPGSNPWAIRHALIYQKSMVQTGLDSYILIRLSKLLGKQFSALLRKTGNEKPIPKQLHWTDIQVMCFLSVLDNWRQYINWLDEEVSALFDRVILASVEPEKLEAYDSASNSLRNMKRSQYLIDQSLRTSHMLDINVNVLEQMQQMSRRVRALEDASRAPLYEEFENRLTAITVDHEFLRKNVLSLISRTATLSSQLRDTVAFRNSEMNNRIGRLTSQGTAAIVDLSHKSSYESRVMKILTILALVYVPISFTADFLQMGYISVVQADGFTVVATKNLLLYAILAIPLVIVTMAIYFAFELLNRKAARKEERWTSQNGDSKV